MIGFLVFLLVLSTYLGVIGYVIGYLSWCYRYWYLSWCYQVLVLVLPGTCLGVTRYLIVLVLPGTCLGVTGYLLVLVLSGTCLGVTRYLSWCYLVLVLVLPGTCLGVIWYLSNSKVPSQQPVSHQYLKH